MARLHVKQSGMPLVQQLEPRLLLSGLEFPPDASIIDVSAAPYNAIPNDGIDDTAAIQQALIDAGSSNRIVYLRDGVYRITGTITWAGSGKNVTLCGQSRDGTILRLDDACAGFTDPAATKIVIDVYTGNVQDAFGNYITDLTVDVGASNPGATAMRFQSNNYGSLRNVQLMSSDAAHRGVLGLNLSFSSPGPLLVKDLVVDGFDTGISVSNGEHSVTMENITLFNQRVVGLTNWRMPLSIHNLTSVNSMPVVRGVNGSPSAGGWGQIVIVGGSLTGGSASNVAIENQAGAGQIFVRDVTTSGYQAAIKEGSTVVPGTSVAQYVTTAALEKFPSPDSTLRLPIEDLAVAYEPLSSWVNVTAFGAIPGDELDDSAAIQAAIDSGASTIYFPTGTYRVGHTIELGGTLRYFLALGSTFEVWSPVWEQDAPVFRVTGGDNPLVMDKVMTTGGSGLFHWVDLAAARTLMIRNSLMGRITNSVPGGKLFLEDVCGGNLQFNNLDVWARQLNPENEGTKITQVGGNLWILGIKTEKNGTIIDAGAHARTEVMGGMLYPSEGNMPTDTAAFVNNESSLSLTITEESWVSGAYYTVWVRETRGGVTRELLRSDLAKNHCNYGKQVPLYTGYVSDSSSPSAPTNLSAVAGGTSQINLSWAFAADGQTGVQAYEIYRNGVRVGRSAGAATSFADTGLADGTSYSYSVYAVNGVGLTGPGASVSGSTAADTAAPNIVDALARCIATRVIVTFSEPVEPASAQNAANYSLSGGLAVTAASLSSDALTVTLTTGPMTDGATYTLSVSNVRDRATSPNTIAPASHRVVTYSTAPAGSGLVGQYYDDSSLGTVKFTQTDGSVNFNWGTGRPSGLTGNDTFSIRWRGLIEPRYTEVCTFHMTHDDGVRLWINGQEIVYSWSNVSSPQTHSGTIALVAGQRYDVLLEYYENTGSAQVRLEWSSARQAREVVPRDCLYVYPDWTTTVRASADATVQYGSTADMGAGTTMTVNGQDDGAGGLYWKSDWIRFDLSALNMTGKDIAAATLLLTLHGGDGCGSGLRTVQVWGLNDSAAGQDWIETGTDHITWATAPGNNNTMNHADGALTTYLGTMVIDNTGYHFGNKGDSLRLTSQALTDFLNADTDGKVTLIIKKAVRNWDLQTLLATQEDTTRPAPGLGLQIGSEPSPAPLTVQLATASDTGASTADGVTKLDNGGSGRQLQFNVTGAVSGAAVTIYAGGKAIGSATAAGPNVTVTTGANFDLLDGAWQVVARQTVSGRAESDDSPGAVVTIDTVAPTGAITPVSPDPRTTAVVSIAVVFSEPVAGLSAGDFAFVREGYAVSPSAATLEGGPANWTLDNLSSLTDRAGRYVLTLPAAGAGVTDIAGNALAADLSDAWLLSAVLGTDGSDSIRIVRNTDPAKGDVTVTTGGVVNAYTIVLANQSQLQVLAGGGDDEITVDFAAGSPLPAGGVLCDGGAGVDLLQIGGTGGDDTLTLTASQATLGAYAVDHANVERRRAALGAGQDTLVVSGTSLDFYEDAIDRNASLAVNVQNGSSVTFRTPQHLRSISLAAGTTAAAAPGGGNTLVLDTLVLAGSAGNWTATLDLADNNLIVRQGDVGAIQNQVACGCADGMWNGRGIRSSVISDSTVWNLQALRNGDLSSPFAEFAGQSVGADAVLVGYTVAGDADLNGTVNSDDYFWTDFYMDTAVSPGAGSMGDLNHDGVTNTDDYFFIDSNLS